MEVINTVINWILMSNGVYDILCACSILWLYNIPGFSGLAKLHPTMFILPHSESSLLKRFLSYWLFTYGSARLIAGLPDHTSDALDVLAAITYFLEAFCFEYEERVGRTMIKEKVTFVSVFSFALGVLVLLRPLKFFPTKSKTN
jgi:hypothetical protein